MYKISLQKLIAKVHFFEKLINIVFSTVPPICLQTVLTAIHLNSSFSHRFYNCYRSGNSRGKFHMILLTKCKNPYVIWYSTYWDSIVRFIFGWIALRFIASTKWIFSFSEFLLCRGLTSYTLKVLILILMKSAWWNWHDEPALLTITGLPCHANIWTREKKLNKRTNWDFLVGKCY